MQAGQRVERVALPVFLRHRLVLGLLHLGHDERGVLARRGEYVTQKWHHTPMFLPCVGISRPSALTGLLVALLLFGGCSESSAPAGIGTRAVVIGIDGADWRAIAVYLPRLHG